MISGVARLRRGDLCEHTRASVAHANSPSMSSLTLPSEEMSSWKFVFALQVFPSSDHVRTCSIICSFPCNFFVLLWSRSREQLNFMCYIMVVCHVSTSQVAGVLQFACVRHDSAERCLPWSFAVWKLGACEVFVGCVMMMSRGWSPLLFCSTDRQISGRVSGRGVQSRLRFDYRVRLEVSLRGLDLWTWQDSWSWVFGAWTGSDFLGSSDFRKLGFSRFGGVASGPGACF